MYACMEALRTQWDGGNFHALAAVCALHGSWRCRSAIVLDVLVVVVVQQESEAAVWGSRLHPCEDRCKVVPCITCIVTRVSSA
jgi:hypothetical protein